MKIEIWTDGSVNRTKNNICSWAFLCKLNQQFVHEDYGELIEEERTGNRAEMTAIIQALKCLYDIFDELEIESYDDVEIIVYSDSQYCVKGINEWSHKWNLTYFQGKKNADLWKEFYSLVYIIFPHPIRFEWIRGHSGIEENERVDELCKRITVKN